MITATEESHRNRPKFGIILEHPSSNLRIGISRDLGLGACHRAHCWKDRRNANGEAGGVFHVGCNAETRRREQWSYERALDPSDSLRDHWAAVASRPRLLRLPATGWDPAALASKPAHSCAAYHRAHVANAKKRISQLSFRIASQRPFKCDLPEPASSSPSVCRRISPAPFPFHLF